MEVLIMKPSLRFWFPWPEEDVSGAILLEVAFSKEAGLAKTGNVNI